MLVNFLNNSINNFTKIKNMPVYNTSKGITPSISFKGVDTFERTSRADDTQNIKETDSAKWNEDRIEAIYNDTYDEVMKQNPLSEELNIEKPKFNIAKDNLSDGMVSFFDYDFSQNRITALQAVFDDIVLYNAADSKGNTKGTFGIHSKQNEEHYRKAAKECGLYLQPIKLNDKEKEALIKVMMAHELRHCIQTHLIASTKGCSRPFKATILQAFKNKQRLYEKTVRELEKLNDEAEALGLPREPINIQPPDYSIMDYSDNFVPKKLVADDIKLKFSISPKDNRYLSTKDHLLAYWQMLGKAGENLNPELYNASPVEIDANNYAYQYFCTKIKKDPKYTDMNPVIRKSIEDYAFDKAKKGISSMKDFGFPDLIRKE